MVETVAISPPPPVEGWFHHGPKILELVERHRPKVCVELGTWMGASAIPVARSVRRWRGTLTCVDTWSGHVSERTDEQPWMLVQCARNLILSGVSPSVRMVVATTAAAARLWTEPIDYLYVDADHSYASVLEDLRAWVPHVKPGGLLVGDDYNNPAFPGVKRAWDEFATERGLTLTRYQSDPPHPEGIEIIHGVLP